MSNSELNTILSSRFEGYAVSPSLGVWTVIEAELNEDEQKKKAIWMWFGGGIAAASLIGFIIYSMASNSQAIDSQIAPVAEKTESTTNETNKLNEKTANSPSKSKLPIVANDTEEKDKIAPQVNGEMNKNLAPNNTYNFEPQERENPVHIAQLERSMIQMNLLTLKQIENKLPSDIYQITYDARPIRMIQLWSVGLNIIAFANSHGLNGYKSDAQSAELIPPMSDPNPGSNDLISTHARYIELNGFIEKRISQRFTVGTGLSVSVSRSHFSELLLSDSTELHSNFDRNYWALGIPIHADFAVVKKGRFNFTAGMVVQPEIRFISRIVDHGTAPLADEVYATNSAFESQVNGNFRRFHLGLQPTLGVDYTVGTRMKLSLQAGYRTYLFRNDYLRSKGVEPSYVTASVGVGWVI